MRRDWPARAREPARLAWIVPGTPAIEALGFKLPPKVMALADETIE